MTTIKHSNRQDYNWLIYDIYLRHLNKFAPFYTGILYDLGAGDAAYKDFFLQHAKKYIAVDWDSSYHDTHCDITADLNKPLPIDSDVADTVVSLSVIEHLCEPQMMLNEACRILKPGGRLVLQVPWQWWTHEIPYDYFRYSPYGLKYLIEKAGFVDVIVEAQSGFFTMLILKLNYFSLRFIRGPRPLRWIIKAALFPMWHLGQKAAPYLDTLDKDWEAETSGYFATAKKP